VCIGLSVLSFATTGCGSESTSANVSNGNGEPDAATTVKATVRSSCGDMPILADAWHDASDECKACIDTECCGEAQACADNPDCKSLWECRSKCDGLVSSCVDACNAALPALPPENGALITCRGRCNSCLDLTSCRRAAPPTPPEPSYALEITCLSYTSTQLVFAGITVKVCAHADHECATPVSQGVTDANGVVTLDVPSDPWFTDAYLEFTGSNVQPTRNYLKSALGREIFARRTMTQRLLDTATTGLANVVAVSCGGNGLAGMTIASSSADAATITGYVDGVAPSPTAKLTDPSGLGGFADHPPGPTTFTVRNAATGDTIGTADAYVRAGFLNGVAVPPSP
jgi:hypothetical protein